jgi:hypothetical protein
MWGSQQQPALGAPHPAWDLTGEWVSCSGAQGVFSRGAPRLVCCLIDVGAGGCRLGQVAWDVFERAPVHVCDCVPSPSGWGCRQELSEGAATLAMVDSLVTNQRLLLGAVMEIQ